MLSLFNKSKKSVATLSTVPHQPSPPRLDRLPPTTHGHPDGGALSRVVMVCKTEQSTVTSTGGAEETVTRVTVSTFRGNNRAERRVTTTEKSTPGTPRTPAIVTPAPQVTEPKVKFAKNGSKPVDFATECLNAHNEYRAIHKVPLLVLNRKLCRYAEEWAKHLAERNAMEHRNDIDLGENIYCCWIGKPQRVPTAEMPVPISGREPVDNWYKEAPEHPYGQEPINLRSGHFSQVVWRDSRELGVGVARSKQGHVFVVANYSPPGNFLRNFAENVPPPGGFPTTNATTMASKPGSSPPFGNDDDELNEAALRAHNEYRRKHGCPDMITDKKVAAYAKEWATHLARENKFMHRPDGEYGENIYTAWSSGGPPMSAAAAAEAACKSWYDEERHYKYGKEPKELKAGHFTQMIWHDSAELGMGIGRGDKNRVVVVANYNPRGNIIGKFATQVPKKN